MKATTRGNGGHGLRSLHVIPGLKRCDRKYLLSFNSQRRDEKTTIGNHDHHRHQSFSGLGVETFETTWSLGIITVPTEAGNGSIKERKKQRNGISQ